MITSLKPLYRYAGGKSRAIKYLSKYLKYAETYVEPFFGGGAVFCHMFNLGLAKHFVINSIRPEIVEIYRAILNNHGQLREDVMALCDRYNSLTVGQKETMFYEIRDQVYETYSPSRYLFILMSCFTGMPNLDTNGRYSISSGHGMFAKRKLVFDHDQIIAWKSALERTQIFCGDFQRVPINYDNALIFFDPPYLGASIDYGSFSKDDQLRCFHWCSSIAQNKNITVLLSNADYRGFFSKISLSS